MQETIRCDIDAGFARWIRGLDGTLVISTYQSQKIVLVGQDDRGVSVLVRDMDKPMGVAIEGERMAVAARRGVVVFADAPRLAADMPGHPPGKVRHLYLPRLTFATGDISAHEIAFGRDGLWIVNTLFSCLCLASPEHSFEPRWKPRFVSDWVPEDRCHLSGLAMKDGAPALVTAHGATDAQGAWRENKVGGGVLVDVESGEPVATGFAMPHSPRIHDGRVWLLDSGLGELVTVDLATGARNPVARVPGFARGLCFDGSTAVVGLSRIREQHLFSGLPICANPDALVAGVTLVDTVTGALRGTLQFTSGCTEIFDVALLPQKRQVQMLDPSKPDALLGLTTPAFAYWSSPKPEA